MRPELVSDEQIRERVLELVASVKNYAHMTRFGMERGEPTAYDCAKITVALADELAELMGRGRLEVSHES